jgi:hypothetical protein
MPAKNRTRQILGDSGKKAFLSSKDDDEAYRLVTQAAVYIASCGSVNEANKLLTALWSRRDIHSRNVWLADRAMTVLWHNSGHFPSTVPFPIADINSIELSHRTYMSGNRWSPEFLDNEQAASPGQLATKRLAKAMIGIYPQGGSMPSREAEIQGIADLESFQQSGFCHGFDGFSALTNLAELCAKNGREQDAERYILAWHDEHVSRWYNFMFECLPACRHASQLLLTGILSNACELNQNSCERYVEDWLSLIAVRFGAGPQLVYQELTWTQLLQRITENSLLESGRLADGNEEHLCHSPAPPGEIDTLEVKLGVQLPDDYKEFLRSSNGFENARSTDVKIAAAEDVGWLRNVYPDLLDIWNTPDLQNTYVGLEQSLLIGDLEGEQQLLLVPTRSQTDGAELTWECWFFASWVPGEVRYSSFRAYVENVLLDLESENSMGD